MNIPEGWKLVPVELLNRVCAPIGPHRFEVVSQAISELKKLLESNNGEAVPPQADAREVAQLRILSSDQALNLKHMKREYAAMKAENDTLRAFANEMVSSAFEGGSFDGGDIQDIAVKHGLLRIEQPEEECGEVCACREYGFPTECYRKTRLLKASAENKDK